MEGLLYMTEELLLSISISPGKGVPLLAVSIA